MKKIAVLLSCFGIGYFLGTLAKASYEDSSFKPYEWKQNPIIVNCVGDDLSETYMARALDFWAIRGHNPLIYFHTPTDGFCDNLFVLPGYIRIKRSETLELDPSTLAITTRKTANFTIVAANITFGKKSLGMPLVYIHELGHAFGYGHAEIYGHIMHPEYEHMGEVFFVP